MKRIRITESKADYTLLAKAARAAAKKRGYPDKIIRTQAEIDQPGLLKLRFRFERSGRQIEVVCTGKEK